MEPLKHLKDKQYYIDLYDTFKEMEKNVSVKEIKELHTG